MTRSSMRVLHVLPGLGSGGGAERSVASTAPFLRDALGTVHVAILTDRRGLVDELERVGVVVHDLSHARGTLASIRAVRRLVRDVDPSLVHASLFDADVATQLAVGRGRPVIVTWTGTPYDPALRSQPGITWWKVQVVRLIEAALGRWSGATYQAVTAGVARSNARALRVAPARVVVAERGRPEPVPVAPEAVDAVRRDLHLAAGARVLFAVARHEPEKDVPTLLDAFGMLAADDSDVVLLVAGRTGSLTARLNARIDDLGLAERVRLLGHRDDVATLLQLADVFVSSSASEGAAGSVMEAMGVGLPIVATAAAGMVGILTDGHDGIVVPVGDAAAIARAVDGLLRDPGGRARLGAAASVTFAERFTVERSAAALIGMYRDVSRRSSG